MSPPDTTAAIEALGSTVTHRDEYGYALLGTRCAQAVHKAIAAGKIPGVMMATAAIESAFGKQVADAHLAQLAAVTKERDEAVVRLDHATADAEQMAYVGNQQEELALERCAAAEDSRKHALIQAKAMETERDQFAALLGEALPYVSLVYSFGDRALPSRITAALATTKKEIQ